MRGKRRLPVQRAMTAGAGTVRSAVSLERTEAALAEVARRGVTDDSGRPGGPKSWEATNLLHLGRALTRAATLRDETRGGHVREDFPSRDDEHFLHHVHLVRGEGGRLEARVVPVPRSNLDGLDLDGPTPVMDEDRPGAKPALGTDLPVRHTDSVIEETW